MKSRDLRFCPVDWQYTFQGRRVLCRKRVVAESHAGISEMEDCSSQAPADTAHQEASPSGSRRSRSAPFSPNTDPAYQPVSSSPPPGVSIEEVDGTKPEDRLERDVEQNAAAFLFSMTEVFTIDTAGLVKPSESDIEIALRHSKDRKMKCG